ncbi:MAG: GMC family oxidoreductase [Acidobacteriaceae bacterium]|nr:GMC family oxidoreductase [Acidobacteriaceae bacterium]
MIIDGNLLDKSSSFRCGVCVVGSGMGGSAVAQKLSEASEDVLLIEAGGMNPVKSRCPPENVLAHSVGNKFGTPVTRAIELGGTSNLWHGGWGMLDEVDFEPRPWIDSSGWPLRRTDLASFYAEAASELKGPDIDQFDPVSIQSKFPERLNDLDFNCSVLQHKVIQIQNMPLRWRTTILELARAQRLRCIVNASALELIPNENSNNVRELIVGIRSGTIRIRADVFIVCAGALETPRLFLNSRSGARSGLCNKHGLVGRYLLDHPMGHFAKVKFARPTKAALYADVFSTQDVRLRVGLKVSREHQICHRLTNNYLWIRPSISRERVDHQLRLSFLGAQRPRDLTLGQIKGILMHRDILYRILVYRFGLSPSYRYGDLVCVTEQLPNPHSCVRLSCQRRDRYGYPIAEVNWQLMDADFACFERYTKLLFERGLLSEQYKITQADELTTWVQTVSSSAHHLGTTRMGKTPCEGVVDQNLKAFGLDNLFVCDGSVFPTAGSVNPSFTIIALAYKLVHYLASTRLRRSF